MKNRGQLWRSIDYQNSLEDRRALSMYLLAGQFRKNSSLRMLEYPVRRRRMLFYCLAGILFGTGLFFVFF